MRFLVLFLVLATAAPAQAATVTMSRQDAPGFGSPDPKLPSTPPATIYGLRIAAGAGETNRITITGEPERIVLTEAGGAALTAGDRCEQESAQRVVCPTPAVEPATFSRRSADDIQLGDGDDELILLPQLAVASVDAGDGNDTVTGQAQRVNGGAGDDRLTGEIVHGGAGADAITANFARGGDGDDTVLGRAGTDTLHGDGGADVIRGEAGDDVVSGGEGADDIDGGAGRDVLSFAERSTALTVDLATHPADPVGEGDRVRGTEGVDGGDGADRITGSTGDDDLRGGGGDDVVDGGGGSDTLAGGEGDDRLAGGAGDDRLGGGLGDDVLDGGAGDDVLDGSAGRDTVRGGSGDDSLTGSAGDRLAGGPGADHLQARGARLSCGSGRDRVTSGGRIGRDCERADPTRQGCYIATRPPLAGDTLRFRVFACLGPEADTVARITVSAGGRTLGKGRRTIPEDRSGIVVVRLTPAALARLRAAKALTISLSVSDDTSTERGRIVVPR